MWGKREVIKKKEENILHKCTQEQKTGKHLISGSYMQRLPFWLHLTLLWLERELKFTMKYFVIFFCWFIYTTLSTNLFFWISFKNADQTLDLRMRVMVTREQCHLQWHATYMHTHTLGKNDRRRKIIAILGWDWHLLLSPPAPSHPPPPQKKKKKKENNNKKVTDSKWNK